MEKPDDVQEYDGYPMPEPDEIKKLSESELEKLIEEMKAKYKKKNNDVITKEYANCRQTF